MTKMKRLLSVVLALVLVLALPLQTQAAGYLFDGDDTSAIKTLESITPAVAKTGSETEFASSKLFGIAVENDELKSVTVPLVITKKGVLDFQLLAHNKDIVGTADFKLTKDEEATNIIEEGTLNELLSTEGNSTIVALEKGTYYLTVTVDTVDTIAAEFLFSFQGILYQSGDQTLKNNTWTVAAKNSTSTYYKLTVTKPSTVSFGASFSAGSSFKVALCNSSKTAISKVSTLYTSSPIATYAVGKGTYYFKVATNSSFYTIKPMVTAVNDKGGTSSSKPTSIKVNSAAKGLITATDKKNKSDYYKITTTKKGQLKDLYISYYGQGSIKVTIKVPGLKAKTTTVKSGAVVTHTYYETMQNGNGSYYRDAQYPKGTYTIKITKPDGTSSGSYEIGTKKFVNK